MVDMVSYKIHVYNIDVYIYILLVNRKETHWNVLNRATHISWQWCVVFMVNLYSLHNNQSDGFGWYITKSFSLAPNNLIWRILQMYTCIYLCMYISIYTCVCVCVYIYICQKNYTCIRRYTYIYTYKERKIYTYTDV